jgi:hypothetical protein
MTRTELNTAAAEIVKTGVVPAEFALKPAPRAPKVTVIPATPATIRATSSVKVTKATKAVTAAMKALSAPATKPTRVKPAVAASTPAADVAPADTFTTVALAREFGKSPKTMRAFVRRHIDALKPLMTATKHVYPNANRAAVIAALKLA